MTCRSYCAEDANCPVSEKECNIKHKALISFVAVPVFFHLTSNKYYKTLRHRPGVVAVLLPRPTLVTKSLGAPPRRAMAGLEIVSACHDMVKCFDSVRLHSLRVLLCSGCAGLHLQRSQPLGVFDKTGLDLGWPHWCQHQVC